MAKFKEQIGAESYESQLQNLQEISVAKSNLRIALRGLTAILDLAERGILNPNTEKDLLFFGIRLIAQNSINFAGGQNTAEQQEGN